MTGTGERLQYILRNEVQHCAFGIRVVRQILQEEYLSLIGQFRFIANRRAKQLQLAEPFPGADNRLSWLDEQASLRKEKTFSKPESPNTKRARLSIGSRCH